MKHVFVQLRVSLVAADIVITKRNQLSALYCIIDRLGFYLVDASFNTNLDSKQAMVRVDPVGIIDLQKRIKTAKEKYREAIQYSSCEVAAWDTHS